MPTPCSVTLRPAALALVFLSLVACGGGVATTQSSAAASGGLGSTSTPSGAGSSSSSSSSSSSGSSSTSSSSGSAASGAGNGSASHTSTGTGPAAQLAAKLGMPARLLIGLGGQGPGNPIAAIQSQRLKPDFFGAYLVGAGAGDWTSWNNPSGYYVQAVAQLAESVGAVPFYTLYQMAQNGDGNLSGLSSKTFMTTYWANVKLMYEQINATGKPALVNLEPDFWGHAEGQSNADPSSMFAYVNSNPDCATLPNDVTGIGGCLIAMARKYAPQAYIGFPPSDWGFTTSEVVSFMNKVGAQKADFIVAQTLNRDAGCNERSPQPSYCIASNGPWYWDESNATHPNFEDHLSQVQAYHTGIANLPVIWWQIPEGVPSSTPGGTDYHYRDNRVHYFLTHPDQLTAVGGLGVVFSGGEIHQTNITTDGGQFQQLDNAYLSSPATLP